MFPKISYTCLLLLLAGTVAYAEPMRPLLSKEKRFPELRRADVSLRMDFIETVDEDPFGSGTNIVTYVPKLRYRPYETLNLYATIPVESIDRDRSDRETGMGDMRAGLELLAFEDIYGYPWVMPHLEYISATGDEDKGLGRGEQSLVFGLAIGSMTWEVVHFVADARFEVFEDSDNVISLGGAMIWDISERFSALVEMRTSDEEVGREVDHPTRWLGGLSYSFFEKFTWIVRGGGGSNAREDTIVSMELNCAL